MKVVKQVEYGNKDTYCLCELVLLNAKIFGHFELDRVNWKCAEWNPPKVREYLVVNVTTQFLSGTHRIDTYFL